MWLICEVCEKYLKNCLNCSEPFHERDFVLCSSGHHYCGEDCFFEKLGVEQSTAVSKYRGQKSLRY
jgi:hypothetical protein